MARPAHCSMLLALLLACGGGRDVPSAPSSPPDTGAPDVGLTDASSPDVAPPPSEGVDAATPTRDPFAPMADTSEGLVNVSADLDALLENGALDGACDRYAANPSDRRLRLLCGKSMFFYEGFDGLGVPRTLYELVGRSFPAELGEAYSALGLVPDPSGPPGRNLGVTPGRTEGTIETLAFGCAACHFAQLPDGRYSVGAPNLRYDYGTQILAITVLPSAAAPGFDASTYAPSALAKVQPALTRLQSDFTLQIQFGLELLPLIGMAASGTLTREQQEAYAGWHPGTMDFLMAPLPLDDEVHTVSKIIDLWSMPTTEEQSDFGMTHALLAWTGGADSLMSFLESFVLIGGASLDEWPRERLEPLRDYIWSLRAPVNPSPPPEDAAARGRAAFSSAGCIGCHEGPRGSSLHWYPYEEIGTDVAMRDWGNPDGAELLCCGLGAGTPATRGIKAPRLTGLWAKSRFLHNGALDSLEQLLCVAPRPDVATPPYGSMGHTFGCELDASTRSDLLAFLRTL